MGGILSAIRDEAWSLGMRAIAMSDCGQTSRAANQHIAELQNLPEDTKEAFSVAKYFAYTLIEPAPTSRRSPCATLFCSVELSTLAAGAALAAEGLNTVVLNMANAYHCGGVWCQARGSQEEGLFRCTSLPLSLWPRRAVGDNRLPSFRTRRETFFPLSEAGVVYTPRMRMIRGEGFGIFAQDPSRAEVAVVSAAAQDLRSPGVLCCAGLSSCRPSFNKPLTRQKIRSILYVAESNGHNAIVLGAFGCGAFANDPELISEIFAELLKEEFTGFDVVVFAVVFSLRLLQVFGYNFPNVVAGTDVARYALLRTSVSEHLQHRGREP